MNNNSVSNVFNVMYDYKNDVPV